MLVAIVTIPVLIKGLGIERFGILNLAWIVIGYFSFFDFGIGKSLTKISAEKIGRNQSDQIPGLFWTSLLLMLGVSLLLSLLIMLFVPDIINFVKISKELKTEALNTLYLLVFSIPIVSTNAGLRGLLEAYQRFGIINILRIVLGISTFLGPLICLIFTKSLFWIILFLILIRIIVWMLYLRQCFKVNINIKHNFGFEITLIQPVFKFGIWITIANIIGPLITNIDRFLIGALISVKAVAYYATPYEIVTKLLLIPDALVAVLFPVFAASFLNNPDASKKLFYSGIKFIFIIIYPIVFLIVTFSYQGIYLWLGEEFAKESSTILQFLAIGILFNSITYIPFNYFQGVGKPSVPAILNLIELPLYLLLMWIFIQRWGIIGAACIWLIRIIIDTTLLFSFSYKKLGTRFGSWFDASSFLLALICLVIPVFFSDIYIKLLYTIFSLPFFLIMVWKYFISEDEKKFLLSKIKFNSM
jgi:O-antigen/teichoic acid export membrane protein